PDLIRRSRDNRVLRFDTPGRDRCIGVTAFVAARRTTTARDQPQSRGACHERGNALCLLHGRPSFYVEFDLRLGRYDSPQEAPLLPRSTPTQEFRDAARSEGIKTTLSAGSHSVT